jgi:hypothetical protein
VAVRNSGTLPDSIIIKENSVPDHYWIPSHSIRIAQNGERDTIFNYEYFNYQVYDYDYSVTWYQSFPKPMGFNLNNIYVQFMLPNDTISGLVRKIEAVNTLYYVTLITYNQLNQNIGDASGRLKSAANMPRDTGSHEISILFEHQGNLLRIYNAGTKRLIFDLVKVSADFFNKYTEFIETNVVPKDLVIPQDLLVGWEGDIPTTAPFANSEEKVYYQAVDNLRLRSSPDTEGEILRTLTKGELVQALEPGLSATIDGIRAPWVWVETKGGTQGWCFAGYLEPVAETAGHDTPGEAAGEEPLPHDSGNVPEESAEPAEKGIPFLGIAAALLALGAAVVVVLRRKTK